MKPSDSRADNNEAIKLENEKLRIFFEWITDRAYLDDKTGDLVVECEIPNEIWGSLVLEDV